RQKKQQALFGGVFSDAPPPLFKSGYSVSERSGMSALEKSSWELICSCWILRSLS
ncbi:unnamed protein product, partial [Eruca vesicaria subsp. sativa]|nr:unnamed protein product [Eruca vesicaria subsp. sativa]